MSTTSPMRRIAASQLIGSTVDGVALSMAVLYFHETVGIPEATIGLVLAGGAALSLLLSVPIGMLADAIGLRTAGLALSLIAAMALGLYAIADGLPVYAAGVACFFVAQSALNAVRQAVVGAAAAPEQRIRTRAIVYTLMNAGLGLGTVIGTLVIVIDLRAVAIGAFVLASLLAIVAGLVFLGLPRRVRTGPSVAAARRPGVVALRDRRFMLVTGLSVVLGVNMPVLSVLLPLWVATRTGAPEWIAALGLGINTLLVLLFQTPLAGRLRGDAGAARYATLAALAFPVACVLIGAAGSLPALAAAAVVLLGIVALTAGEILGGLAGWHLAFHDVPAEVQGQYQGTFAMAASLSRILGPLVVLPLILALGLGGWSLLGLAFAAACLGVATVAGRAPHRAAVDAPLA